MSAHDDDLSGIGTEGIVYQDSLEDFLGDLRTLATQPAPEPSPALGALLRGDPGLRRPAPRTVRPARRVAAAVLAAAVVAVITAAETHDLPAPAQHVVSSVLDHLSPLHLRGIAHQPAPGLGSGRTPLAPVPSRIRRLHVSGAAGSGSSRGSRRSAVLSSVQVAHHAVPRMPARSRSHVRHRAWWVHMRRAAPIAPHPGWGHNWRLRQHAVHVRHHFATAHARRHHARHRHRHHHAQHHKYAQHR